MRLLPAPTEHAGPALMEDPLPDACARTGTVYGSALQSRSRPAEQRSTVKGA